ALVAPIRHTDRSAHGRDAGIFAAAANVDVPRRSLHTQPCRAGLHTNVAIHRLDIQLSGCALHRDRPADDVEVQTAGDTRSVHVRAAALRPHARPGWYTDLERGSRRRYIGGALDIEFRSATRSGSRGSNPTVEPPADRHGSSDDEGIAVP